MSPWRNLHHGAAHGNKLTSRREKHQTEQILKSWWDAAVTQCAKNFRVSFFFFFRLVITEYWIKVRKARGWGTPSYSRYTDRYLTHLLLWPLLESRQWSQWIIIKKQQWPSAEWGSVTLGGERSHSHAAADSQMCSDVICEWERSTAGVGGGYKRISVMGGARNGQTYTRKRQAHTCLTTHRGGGWLQICACGDLAK